MFKGLTVAAFEIAEISGRVLTTPRHAIVSMMGLELHEEMFPVPRSVRFPVEVNPPPNFAPDDPATWPKLEGRLEYVAGRLLLMPPCGKSQQRVSVDVVTILGRWLDEHPEFVVGGNEAGMILGGETRGAEAAVWLSKDLPEDSEENADKFILVPPILAVEVAGRDEGESELKKKAAWYLDHHIKVVWIVLPKEREVIVIEPDCEFRFGTGQSLPDHVDLPGLHPPVERFFRQLRS